MSKQHGLYVAFSILNNRSTVLIKVVKEYVGKEYVVKHFPSAGNNDDFVGTTPLLERIIERAPPMAELPPGDPGQLSRLSHESPTEVWAQHADYVRASTEN